MFQVQVNDSQGVLKELVWMGMDRQVGEMQFLATCRTVIPNFDEYSPEDVETVLGEGFESFGGGTVMFIDTSNVATDEELTAELGNFPAKTVDKIIRWHNSGEIGEVATIDEALEAAGRCLDAAQSHEICGPVLFQGEDGEWYVITVEAVVAKAHPDYVRDELSEDSP